MPRYCVGPTMAVDWGEDEAPEMIARWFGMLMMALQTAGPALIMGFGGWLVLTGRTTVGTVFVFATVLGGRLTGSLSSLATMHVNVTGSLAVFRRLFEYTDLPPQVADQPGATDLGTARGAIRFQDVTFSYPGASRPALDGISIGIEAGQLAALVGPSGAGKTTLTTLVPRFADPVAGRVLIDGHDLRSITLESADLTSEATLYERQFLAQDQPAARGPARATAVG